MTERIKVLKFIGQNQNKEAGGILKEISYYSYSSVGEGTLTREALMGCKFLISKNCRFRWLGRCDGWTGKNAKPDTLKVVYCGRKIKEETPYNF